MPSSLQASVGWIGIGRRWPKSAVTTNGRAAPKARPMPMPTSRDQHHLREVEHHHLPARSAEALEGGDRGALAVDEAAHRIGDADAAHEQRGQADQGQELREALDVAGKARIGVEARADVPARLRQDAVGLGLDPGSGPPRWTLGRQVSR